MTGYFDYLKPIPGIKVISRDIRDATDKEINTFWEDEDG